MYFGGQVAVGLQEPHLIIVELEDFPFLNDVAFGDFDGGLNDRNLLFRRGSGSVNNCALLLFALNKLFRPLRIYRHR